MSSLSNITRSLAKTFKKFTTCGAPRPIGNSIIGTDESQCGKFQRFKNLYNEFKKDQNQDVSYLVKEINSTIFLYDGVLTSVFDSRKESAQEFINRLDGFADLMKSKQNAYLHFLNGFPESPKYDQLKGELYNFINFMVDYYVSELNRIVKMEEEANIARQNFRKSISTGSTISNPSNRHNFSNSNSNSNSNSARSLISVNSKIPNWKGRKGRKSRNRTRKNRKN